MVKAGAFLLVVLGYLAGCGPRFDPQAELTYCRTLPDVEAVPCFKGLTARLNAASGAINTIGGTMPRTYSGSVEAPDGSTTRYRTLCSDRNCDTKIAQ
ncbi:hypothetical protein M5E06_21090 [Azospirillum sp. A1-3]|uniref:hypothetical protein n=1 Tax=Azospirillum sp. A1-3 TaxID=185874 RepID=UPI002076FE74|nr:hypothetical protein [Azospirillum sp. A1-3]MCM8736626.1 hypothetical protein [Azospirillum sp. A1-3]